MAKDIDNSWASSANYIDANSESRVNPYADDANAEKLYGIDTYGTRHSVSFTWAVTTAGAQIAFTPATGATTATDYVKFRVTDEHGNEAYSTGFQSSAATAALNVDTSGLDPDDDWEVLYQTSNTDGASKVAFAFVINSGAIYSNSSATVSYSF